MKAVLFSQWKFLQITYSGSVCSKFSLQAMSTIPTQFCGRKTLILFLDKISLISKQINFISSENYEASLLWLKFILIDFNYLRVIHTVCLRICIRETFFF